MIWPAVCLLLVTGAGADLWLRHGAPRAAEAAAAGAAKSVQTTLDALPYRHGPWIGVAEEPPELPPDVAESQCAVARRTYTDILTGRSAEVIVLYCSDAEQAKTFGPEAYFTGRDWQVRSATPVDLGGSATRTPVPALLLDLERDAGLNLDTLKVISLAATPTGWAAPRGADAAVVHLLFEVDREAQSPTATAADLLPVLQPVLDAMKATP